MSQHLFSHADISSTDTERSRPVWDAFMVVLGAQAVYRKNGDIHYILRTADSVRSEFVILYQHRAPACAGCRFAFAASSVEQVDRSAQAVRDAGARNIEGPSYHPEYDPSFYAVYFEDPTGIQLEICHHHITR